MSYESTPNCPVFHELSNMHYEEYKRMKDKDIHTAQLHLRASLKALHYDAKEYEEYIISTNIQPF